MLSFVIIQLRSIVPPTICVIILLSKKGILMLAIKLRETKLSYEEVGPKPTVYVANYPVSSPSHYPYYIAPPLTYTREDN